MSKSTKVKKNKPHKKDGGVIVNTDPTPIGKCPKGYIKNADGQCVPDVG